MMFSLAILVMTFLIEGIYGLIINSEGDYCVNDSVSTKRCINNEVSILSIGNKMNDPTSYYIKSWLNFITICIILILLQLFRRHQRLTDREIDRGLTSPSDYTIMLTKLPIGEYDESDIRSFVKNLWEKENPNSKLNIIKIIMAYKISHYIEILKKKEELRLQLAKAEAYFNMKGKYSDDFNIENINKELNELQTEKNQAEKDLNKGILENACGVVFITFGSQEGYHFS